MTNRNFFVCALCASALWIGVPAWAADAAKAEDWLPAQKAACFNDKAIFTPYTIDERIANCTAAIESGEYDGETLAWLYNNRGTHHSAKREFDLALADFAKALEVKPGFTAPLSNRAGIYLRMERLGDALSELNQLVTVQPDLYEAYVLRSTVYFKMDKLDLALADASHAVELNSNRALAYAARGGIEFFQGNVQAAMKDFDTGADVDSRSASLYNSRCFARALLKQDMDSKALSDCNKAIKLMPGTAGVIDTRGFLYLQLGRYKDAIKDYDAALAIDPKLAASLYGRGLARQQSGDADGGAADMTAAAAIRPNIAKEFGTLESFRSGS